MCQQGDRVLPVVMPHLNRGLVSNDPSMRQGVCMGLSEVLSAATNRQIEQYIDVLLQALQQALCDSTPSVRKQAARAFQTLFKSVGIRAIEEVVPSLLRNLVEESNSSASSGEEPVTLMGLREIVQARPREMLEYLLSKLAVHPMKVFSAKALGGVIGVCSQQLIYQIQYLVPFFCSELQSVTDRIETMTAQGSTDIAIEDEKQRLAAIKQCAAATMAAVNYAGLSQACTQLAAQMEHDTDIYRHRWGAWLLEQLIKQSKVDCSEYCTLFLKYLLARIAEVDRNAQQAVLRFEI